MKITLERDEIISILEAHINQILASEPTAEMKVQYGYDVSHSITFVEAGKTSEAILESEALKEEVGF